MGAVERGDVLPKPVRPGDAVLALASSGVHSNGFSLVRKIVADDRLALADPAPFEPGRSLGEALLTPTRIYVAPLLKAIRTTGAVKALAHITGGGITDNLPRVIPDAVAARIDLGRLRPPPVFGWLARHGIDEAEMLRTYNCGVGMVVVTGERRCRARHGFPARRGRDRDRDRRDRGACRAGPRGRLSRHSRLRRRSMRRTRVAVLISGRGSNMASLLAAAARSDYPAEIVRVISNTADAAGLRGAADAGVPTTVIDHRGRDRAEFEADLDASLRAAGVGAGVPCGVHAPAVAVVRRALA